MKKRLRILVSLVEKYYDDVFFLVDTVHTYVQEVIPRVRWLRPLGYEINVDEASVAIIALLVEEVDKEAIAFGNYELAKSKISMELKTTSVIKKKNKLVKKLKEKFGEGVEEEEEEEETQGQGEDQQEEETKIAEGVEGEEAEEAPTPIDKKKRKAKTPTVTKPKKIAKLNQPKPPTPTTRASTRVTAQKAKEVAKPKQKEGGPQKRPRRKYVAQAESDEERTEFDDNSQFQVVSHSYLSDLDNLCENVRNNVDLSGFSHIKFDNLGKIEKNQVEDAIYAMMATLKKAPLEISNSIPKSLYERVEQKWHYCLDIENKIREIALAQVMPKLSKAQMSKAIKRYVVIFVPKYRAFNILQKNIEDVVKKSKQMWKITYGLAIVKEGEQEPIEVKDDDNEEGIVE